MAENVAGNGIAGYRLLDHTADAGVVAWASTPAGAFAMAARGMFEIVLGEDPENWVGAGEPAELRVEAEGSGWADLLVNWLAELIYLFDVEGFVPTHVEFDLCEPPACAAGVRGITLENPGDTYGTAIKAVTYHQLEVHVTPERTELRVIFDI